MQYRPQGLHRWQVQLRELQPNPSPKALSPPLCRPQVLQGLHRRQVQRHQRRGGPLCGQAHHARAAEPEALPRVQGRPLRLPRLCTGQQVCYIGRRGQLSACFNLTSRFPLIKNLYLINVASGSISQLPTHCKVHCHGSWPKHKPNVAIHLYHMMR